MKRKIIFFVVSLLASISISYASEPKDLKLYFAFDSYKVTKKSQEVLSSNINALSKDNIVGFEIYGYCDDLGTNSYNDRLSRKRANAIQKALVDLGIPRKNINKIQGLGEIQLQDNDPINEQREKNRRVEIRILYRIADSLLVINTDEPAINATIKNDLPLEIENQPKLIENEKKIVDQSTIAEETIAEPKNEDDELDILTVMSKGERLTLEEILFVSGTAKLIKSSEIEIKRLAKTLQKNSNIKIQILGHVCCARFGLDGKNYSTGKRNLSVVRAKAVYDKLKNLGVSTDQMIYEGRKSKEPLGGPVENDRRVEIMILDL